MRAIKRHLAAAGLLMVMALSLTGCVHLDRNVALNGDGSGSYVLTIGINDQLLSLSGGQTTTMMNNFGDQVKKDGGSYRQYDDAGYTYWAYTRPFKSVPDLNNFLQQMPSSGSSSTGASGSGNLPSSGADTLSFTEQSGFLTNTFHVTGHISLNIQAGATSAGGVDASPYLKDMRDSFAVTMPGSITSHKGGTVNGNTVTYTVHYGEETDIDVVGSGLNTGVLIPIGAGVAIILLAIAGFIIWGRRSAGPNHPATQAAYSGMGAQPTAQSWPTNPSMPPHTLSATPTPQYGPPSASMPPYGSPSPTEQSPWPGAPTTPPYGQ